MSAPTGAYDPLAASCAAATVSPAVTTCHRLSHVLSLTNYFPRWIVPGVGTAPDNTFRQGGGLPPCRRDAARWRADPTARLTRFFLTSCAGRAAPLTRGDGHER